MPFQANVRVRYIKPYRPWFNCEIIFWSGFDELSKRVTSEASINQLGAGVSPHSPRKFFEFRTPESESERNLTNYFIILLLLFFIKNVLRMT